MEWRRMIYHGSDLGDYYLISDHGDILGIKTHHIRKQLLSDNGYKMCSVSLGCRERKVCVRVHRAVAETFIPNPENKPEVNHLDGNKLNNCVDNLEWVTGSENMIHASENGLLNTQKCEDNCFSKLTKEKVEWARSVYVPRDKQYGLRCLARLLGVDHSTLRSAIICKTWV